jgi:hypothetical protein
MKPKLYSNPYQDEVWKAKQEMNDNGIFISFWLVFLIVCVIGFVYLLIGK